MKFNLQAPHASLCMACINQGRGAGGAITMLTTYAMVAVCDWCSRLADIAMVRIERGDGVADQG